MHKQLVLPQGEVLLHCGDLVGNYGDDCDIVGDVMKLARWLNKQPFRRVFVIPGNHDIELDVDKYPQYAKARQQFVASLAPHVTLLHQSGAEYRGLRIWGSPVLVDRLETMGKRYYSNGFETPESQRRGLWAQLPEALDVLMTHTPPWGDSGDPLLAERLRQLQHPPLVHCMGHAHREVGVGLHTVGVESVPVQDQQGQTELRRRIYLNAAQERLLGDERGCGGAAWVFDLMAKD
jgi:Icc-related predicted phosphoesterase